MPVIRGGIKIGPGMTEEDKNKLKVHVGNALGMRDNKVNKSVDVKPEPVKSTKSKKDSKKRGK